MVLERENTVKQKKVNVDKRKGRSPISAIWVAKGEADSAPPVLQSRHVHACIYGPNVNDRARVQATGESERELDFMMSRVWEWHKIERLVGGAMIHGLENSSLLVKENYVDNVNLEV
ncbi:hypothetical protein V6N13_105520 [Hibiscus sabdariffa]